MASVYYYVSVNCSLTLYICSYLKLCKISLKIHQCLSTSNKFEWIYGMCIRDDSGYIIHVYLDNMSHGPCGTSFENWKNLYLRNFRLISEFKNKIHPSWTQTKRLGSSIARRTTLSTIRVNSLRQSNPNLSYRVVTEWRIV